METSENIQNKINKVMDSADAVQSVEVSPFFKDKTLQRLFAEKKVKQPLFWSWFTPKLQLATLVGFVVLNAFAYFKINSTTYDEKVDAFADSYGLSVGSEFSFLN